MRWLNDLRGVRLGSSDLDASVRFATEILGLELVRRDAQRAYLRAGDGRDHHLVYVRGDLRAESLVFEVSGASSAAPGGLEGAAASLAQGGHVVREGTRTECDDRHVEAMFALTDPTGNRIELVQGLAPGGPCAWSREAGITSFSHVGLRTTDPGRDELFWTASLGARVSDWIGEAALLRIDDVHHKIALFPSKRPGVQHVNFQVASFEDVMRSYYFLQTRGVRVVFGPGRHPTSSAIFVYFQGPDDIVYEYSTGVRLIPDEQGYVPRRFPFAPSSFCMWGSRPDIPEFRVTTPPSEPIAGSPAAGAL
jgi:2,3-dihydroxy-p-cumate/2,3-dihydroxybenzoate 3,4-dioxygenase